ncbi:unnamed protein product [Didymodactylos carnosus]|uniref:Uncharacterized protein n=1 Tax=Didymodactylos carnosus TaxID=1234261 RepID=A0A8S2RVQ3_9BILA|nr:unnamed protein product [Didymodactylos carnosus]CAF4186342.1 unnamed protein product [Didymodactylos carnosus]
MFKRRDAVSDFGSEPKPKGDKGTVDHVRYIQEVLPVALAYGNEVFGDDWTFQQDGAGAHKHQLTQKWCRDHFPSFITEDQNTERLIIYAPPVITTASATQCHQAARCLIDAGLLSLQSRLVANNTQYCEVYLKAVPSLSLEILPFMKQLNKFNIDEINEYLATLKTVDTKNATYLTEDGFSLLSTEPYATYVMDIDKLKIKTPSKKTTARIYSGNSQRPNQIKLQQTQTQSIVLSPQMDEIDKINLQETIIADYGSKRKRSAHSSSVQTRSATKKPRF